MSANPEESDTPLDFARRAAAPFARMNALAVRNVERLARLQYDLAGDWMRFAIDQVQATVTAGDLGTLLSRQAAITGQFVEKATRRQQDLARISAETQADFTGWIVESTAP